MASVSEELKSYVWRIRQARASLAVGTERPRADALRKVYKEIRLDFGDFQ